MSESEHKSGLQFLSAGSVESMFVGSTYELKVGSVNEIMVGSEAKINAAVSNSLSLEAELAYKYGGGVEWNNVGGYKIEDGEVFEFKEESEQFATKEIKLQAARTLSAQVPGVPLDGIKATIKKALLAIAAVNVAIGSVEAGLLASNTLGESEQGGEGVEQNGWKAGSAGVISSAVSAGASLAAYQLVKHAIEALMTAYKQLPAVSTVTLTATGIKQQTNFTATGGMINMAATGVSVKSGPGTVGLTGNGELACLNLLANGNTILNGAVSTTVSSPADVKAGQVAAGVFTSGLSSTPAEVILKNTDASKMSLMPASAKITSAEVSMLAGVNGFSANPGETKMVWGTSKMVADVAAVTMSSGPTASFAIHPSTAILTAPLVKIG